MDVGRYVPTNLDEENPSVLDTKTGRVFILSKGKKIYYFEFVENSKPAPKEK
jgi:hypothetical protein